MNRAALAGQLPTEQKILLRTSDELLGALRSSRYGKPTGLGAVIDEAVKKGKMVDLDTFMRTESSIYEKSWVPSLSTIIKWSLRQAGLWNNGSYDNLGRLKIASLVLIEGLERLTQELSARQAETGQAITDRVMSRDMFSQLLMETEIGGLSQKELDILLRFLSRDKQMLSYDSETVKFKARSGAKCEPISEEDANIASMKALIASLTSQVSSLERKISDLQSTAQAAVQSKNRHAALSAIRSRKLAEKNLEQRTNTLNQLEEVFSKIEQAVDQVQVMQVMQASAETLRSLNQRVGGADKVDAIMDDLREQMGQADEVGQIMQEPLDGKAVMDDAEIDDELEALEKDEVARKESMNEDAVRVKLADLENAERAAKNRAAVQAEKEASDALLDADIESSSQKLEQIRLSG